MTQEEQLIQRYFDAFNCHDIEGVMACFHDDPVIVDAEGRRFAGREEVRRSYETSFALFPDGRCDLRSCTGNDAIGAEVLEISDGKIKEIRDYHKRVRAAVADNASVAEAVH
jgi:hypothetical protein